MQVRNLIIKEYLKSKQLRQHKSVGGFEDYLKRGYKCYIEMCWYLGHNPLSLYNWLLSEIKLS